MRYIKSDGSLAKGSMTDKQLNDMKELLTIQGLSTGNDKADTQHIFNGIRGRLGPVTEASIKSGRTKVTRSC